MIIEVYRAQNTVFMQLLSVCADGCLDTFLALLGTLDNRVSISLLSQSLDDR